MACYNPHIGGYESMVAEWAEPVVVDNIIPGDSWVPEEQCGTIALQIVAYTEFPPMIKTQDVFDVFRVTEGYTMPLRPTDLELFDIKIGTKTGMQCAFTFTKTGESGTFVAACIVGFNQAFPSRFYNCQMSFIRVPRSVEMQNKHGPIFKNNKTILNLRKACKRIEEVLRKYNRETFYAECVYDMKFDVDSCLEHFKKSMYQKLYVGTRSENEQELFFSLLRSNLEASFERGSIKTSNSRTVGNSVDRKVAHTENLLTELALASKLATILSAPSDTNQMTSARQVQSASSHHDTGRQESASRHDTGRQESASRHDTGRQESASRHNTGIQESASRHDTGRQESASHHDTGRQESASHHNTGIQESGSEQYSNKVSIEYYTENIAYY